MEIRTTSDDGPVAVWLTSEETRGDPDAVHLVLHGGTRDDPQSLVLHGTPAELSQMLQRVQEALGRMGAPHPRQDANTVYIQVTGGGAYVHEKPPGVAVVVQDFDIDAGDGTAVRVYPAGVTIRHGNTAF